MKSVNKVAFTFVDNVAFNNERTTYTSSSFNCIDYKEFSLIISKAVSGTPTDVVIQVQVSDDNITFYDLSNDFWGDLRYEDTANSTGQTGGTQLEAVKGSCPYIYMRITITTTGTGANNIFTMSVKGMFMD